MALPHRPQTANTVTTMHYHMQNYRIRSMAALGLSVMATLGMMLSLLISAL